jgi:exopolysaccharide biosynthesis polyprenyl glycosylphosphotransferase
MNERTLERILQGSFDITSLLIAWYLTLALPLSGPSAFGRELWAQGSVVPPPIAVVAALWFLVALWAGVYRIPDKTHCWVDVRIAARASMAVAVAVAIAGFFWAQPRFTPPRSFVLILAGLSFILFTLSRLGAGAVAQTLTEHWRARGGVAVLGADAEALSILERLRMSGRESVRGLIALDERGASDFGGGPVLGSASELAEVINREKLNRIVMSSSSLSQVDLETFTEISTRMGVTMSYAVAVAVPARNLNYSVLHGISLLEIEPVSFTQAERLIKRVFDIIGSSLLLVLFTPVMLLIALLVKVTSEGPILFAAPRIGRGGRYFTFLKFRTMYSQSNRMDVGAKNEKDGHLFKIKEDPRVTALGRILRRYSLDELPQLMNVMVGDMSLVGPRPLPIEDMEPDGMSRRFAIWSEQRASVPPGITGLWQIRGRSDLPFLDLVKHDLEYVHNWSLSLDFQILLKTPKFVLIARGAH